MPILQLWPEQTSRRNPVSQGETIEFSKLLHLRCCEKETTSKAPRVYLSPQKTTQEVIKPDVPLQLLTLWVSSQVPCPDRLKDVKTNGLKGLTEPRFTVSVQAAAEWSRSK
jgi:hypothetical protein